MLLARQFSAIIGGETLNIDYVEADDNAYRGQLAIKLIRSLDKDKLTVYSEFGLSIVDVTVGHIEVLSRDSLRDSKHYDDYCAILKRDNEMIPANVVEEVENIIGIEFPPEKNMPGMRRAVWPRMKALYAEHGYTWHSPQDLHPAFMFD